MRILFAGTPEVALPGLRAMVDAGHEVAAVLTRPDAAVGRSKKLVPSPVAALATDLGLPVLKPERPSAELAEQIRELNVEAAAVVAFGMLLTQPMLDAVPGGWVNLHFSLLPAWRGAAPVQRSILAGDTETGATTFRIVKALDAGPVYRTLRTEIAPHETSGELLDRLAIAGAPLLLDSLADIAAGVEPTPQPDAGVTLAPKINPADVRIDWSRPAVEIDRLVRAASPAPGAWTLLDGERFRVLLTKPTTSGPELGPGELQAGRKQLWVGTGDGVLELDEVQGFGKKPMRGADWARGQHWAPDQQVRFDG